MPRILSLPSRRAVLLLPLLGLSVSACYVTRHTDPLPLRATYVAPDGFTLVSRDASRTSAGGVCRVRRAELEVERVRADTIYFARVRLAQPVRGAPPCDLRGPGVLSLTAFPEVRRERWVRHHFTTVLASIPVLVVILYVAGGLS
jgi:hypothetical protein